MKKQLLSKKKREQAPALHITLNGQQRITAIHRRQPHDRAPLTTLVDGASRRHLDRAPREMSALDFYKFLGYDIYQFGNCGLAENEQVWLPCDCVRRDFAERWTDLGNGCVEHIVETSRGALRRVTRNWHPVKYPVETLDDLKVLRHVWENTEYAANLEGREERCRRMAKALEGHGVYVPVVAPSALQMLLEDDVGMERFYYMLQDYPSEVEDLVALIHDRRCQEYRLVAKHDPHDACVACENTSTSYISPAVYRRFSQRHLRDFSDIMHGEGKLAILHMCGFLDNLLDDLKPTNLDGIHALTGPPVGDCSIHRALDVLGGDLIIIALLDSTKILCPNYSPEAFTAHIEELVTERCKKANVIFWLQADGVEVPLDRFTTAGEWFSKNAINKGTPCQNPPP